MLKKLNEYRNGLIVSAGAAAGVLGNAVSAFAEDPPVVPVDPAFVVSSLDLAPIVDTITGNLTVILPVGLTILAIMVGVSLIPRILQKFF